MRHAQAGLLLDPAHRRLGGQAGADRLAHAPPPAGVVGEHAVGLEDLAVLAVGDLGQQQQLVDRGAQAGDRLLEARRLAVRVVRDQAGDLDPQLVQHRAAERHAFDQTQTLQPLRAGRPAGAGRETGSDRSGRPRRTSRRTRCAMIWSASTSSSE